MKERVVVTGLGAVTPLGNDVATMWEGLLTGRSGVARSEQLDAADLEVKIAAEVKGFDPIKQFGRREARRNDRFALLAKAAADEAVADAGLTFEDWDDEAKGRVGVLVGTGIGGVLTLLAEYDVLRERGPERVSPLMVPKLMPNSASASIAIQYGLRGPNYSLSSACATGSHGLGEAAGLIQRGITDVMICGGAEAAAHPLSVAALANMKALSTRNDEPERASRPFDAERDGFVLGEGAGILVLERLEHAIDRGARIRAEVIGYAATCDAYHIAAPDESGEGAMRAMAGALKDAGLTARDVNYINAHGTGTQLNDPIETQAIRRVFGAHADRLAVSSTKSMMGHLMGAAGAIEAIVCVRSLETGWVHATVNYEHPDPACDLDYVPNEPRKLSPRVILSSSFGFGGHNACILLRRWESTRKSPGESVA